MRLLIFSFVFLFVQVAFAQEYSPDWVPVDPVFVPPLWLETLILFLYGIPTVGPILVEAGKWAGVIAVILTSLAGTIIVSAKAIDKGLNKTGLTEKTGELEKFLAPVIYWLKYFSLLNAPKTPSEKK